MFYSRRYGLKLADRIIGPIFAAGFSKHHAIYLGGDFQGVEWIAENFQGKGVQMMTGLDYFSRNRFVIIQPFLGNKQERNAAVKRALGEMGKPYNQINYNCEHFAEFVQNNQVFSGQFEFVREAFQAVALFLIFIGLINNFNKN